MRICNTVTGSNLCLNTIYPIDVLRKLRHENPAVVLRTRKTSVRKNKTELANIDGKFNRDLSTGTAVSQDHQNERFKAKSEVKHSKQESPDICPGSTSPSPQCGTSPH
jgi:hypothetical protein